jgi:hypothetical protein
MKLKYRLIQEGEVAGRHIPLHILFVDQADIHSCGIEIRPAMDLLAREVGGAVGINVFDMNAVTTTSDGIMVDTALVAMAAADNGRINPDFGYLEMANIPFSKEIVEEEPHLRQWEALYPGKKLFRGPDPSKKLIPVHNVVISGRAANNNSATEMMNIVTMEEILLPYLGQREIMTGGDEVLVGNTGEVISVGIGMTIKEKFGRVFPTRQFGAGDTAHGSGEYAKTLKRDIPCIVAPKAVLARHTIKAFEAGMVPGRDIGCSPVVLSIARAMGLPIAYDNITERAREELASVGITFDHLMADHEILTAAQVIEQADRILPGVSGGQRVKVGDLVQTRCAKVA